MDWEAAVMAVVEGWQHTTEMPAVPINHSLPVIDSANVVWKRQRKLEGINHWQSRNFSTLLV